MYSTIVVGTDGSPTAEIAVNRAAEIATLSGARLHVLSSYAPAAAHVVGGGGEYAVGADYKADAVLERTMDALRGNGIQVEQHAPKGDPGDAIVELARQVEADLVIVGSRGMQGARRLLGSVPNKVSHSAPCDVLIVQTT
jgi:nucleotide-binding universal stress UspA family protein